MAFDYNRSVNAAMTDLVARVDAYTALGTLSLTTALQSGTAVSGWILGATKGSVITSNIPGITVNSAQRTYSGTPTGGAQTIANGLVETPGATGGSAKSTSISVAAAAATPVSISGTPPTTGQVGTAYSFTPTTANGSGTKTYTLSSGTLLGGLSFSMSSGAITGTPTVAGTMSNLVITVTDSTGSASTAATTVTIAAATSGATFTASQQPTPYRIYQRSAQTGGGASKGSGTVQQAVNVTGSGAIYARTRAADGTTVNQAAWLVTSNAAVSNGTINISGVDARLGWFYLDLAPSATGPWQQGTVLIGMGDLIGYAGQSLMVTMTERRGEDSTLISATGVVPSDFGRVAPDGATGGTWRPYTDNGLDNPVQRTSAGGAALLNEQIALWGVNIGLVGYAEGATALAVWQPGQTQYNKLMANIALAGSRLARFIFMQGHNDPTTSLTEIATLLTGLFDGIKSTVTNGFPIYVCSIPNCLHQTQWGTGFQRDRLRYGYYRWSKMYAGATYVEMRDLELIDDVHQSQRGAIRTAYHWHRAIKAEIPALNRTNVGARVSSVSYSPSSTDMVLNVTLPAGATTLSAVGNPASRVAVYKRGGRTNALALDSTTPLAIGAVSNGVVPVTVRLAAAPGDTELDLLWTLSKETIADGSANGLFDNQVDGDGANFGRQLAQPYGVAFRKRTDMTVIAGDSGAYVTGKFGQTVNSRVAAPAGARLTNGRAQGYTIVFWVNISADPGNSVMITCNGYLQSNSTLDLRWNNAVIKAAAFTLGQWQHVAIQCEGVFTDFYIDGAYVGRETGRFNDVDDSRDFVIRALARDGGFNASTMLVDEVAIFDTIRYTTAGFTPPTAPYADDAPGLAHIWHFNGNLNDSAVISTANDARI